MPLNINQEVNYLGYTLHLPSTQFREASLSCESLSSQNHRQWSDTVLSMAKLNTWPHPPSHWLADRYRLPSTVSSFLLNVLSIVDLRCRRSKFRNSPCRGCVNVYAIVRLVSFSWQYYGRSLLVSCPAPPRTRTCQKGSGDETSSLQTWNWTKTNTTATGLHLRRTQIISSQLDYRVWESVFAK